MNPFFFIVSVAYVFAIFFWADSPIISQISVLNPHSLLHVPLYGILTVLLMLAFCWQAGKELRRRKILVAIVVIVIAFLDEFHQSFLPIRDASLTDVLLDLVGILLAMGFASTFRIFRGISLQANHQRAGNDTERRINRI